MNPRRPGWRSISCHFMLLAVFAPNALLAQNSLASLRQAFLHPPDNARPMMRWWWFGIAVKKPEIRHELEQMRADGIGGVELAFVYPQSLDDPARGIVNDPFLSPAMLDNVRYAAAQARRLGLRLDITLGSGWPYGGPATSLDQAAQHLRVAQIALPQTSTTLPAVKLAQGESILSTAVVTGAPDHWLAASAQTFAVGYTGSLPAVHTHRTALVFIASPTGQTVKRAASGAEGWVLDPFSRTAVATHLSAVGEPLMKALAPYPPYAVFSDSLEAYGADWSPHLPEEFRKRRGYDLLPHLPELVSGGSPRAAKIRHDWGKTLTELLDENYLQPIDAWARVHHTKFRSQSYGEPAVSFSSQRLAALAEGEGPQWRSFSTLRWATSANHVFSRNITSAETFTWLHSPVFTATPLDMKAEVDLHFLMGVNQIIGHGWPYSPSQAGEPGWSLYAAAVFNDHNPWHPVMPDVTGYIQRVSYLLRQGQPANQVAVLLPTDDAWANFSPGKVSVTEEMLRLVPAQLVSSILSSGYNFDFIDADAVNSVGIGHPLLVLPPTDRIPLATLKKIRQYVAAGGHAVAVGRAPTLDAEGQASDEITALSHQLFDASNSTYLPDAAAFQRAWPGLLPPDLRLTGENGALGFVRRKLPRADIYFVANTSNHPVDSQGTFATAHPSCERWFPETARTIPCSGSNNLPLHLAPYESAVFVFSDSLAKPAPSPMAAEPSLLADLSSGWNVTFTATKHTVDEPRPTDWTADPATRFYSGEAVYQHDFHLDQVPAGKTSLEVEGGAPIVPPPDTGNPEKTPGMRAWFDPPIRCAAIVSLNGRRVGSLWHPPYNLDVTGFLRRGDNHLEIRVFNTAINAWSALPPRDDKPLIAKFGDRFQMQDLDQVQPLSSGLLGSIHILMQISKGDPAPLLRR